MMQDRDSTGAFESILAESDAEHYLLRLYVAGMTPRSADALARIKAVCEEHLKGRYELEVIVHDRLTRGSASRSVAFTVAAR